MEFVIWLVLGVVVGGVIGAGLTWWFAGRGSSGSVEKLKRENEAFREEVTEHFVDTARLINQLTDSYKAVFDHLSGGAEKLVDRTALAERMPRVSDREVRLRHLGATEPGRFDRSGKAGDDPLKQRPERGAGERGKRSEAAERKTSGTDAPSAKGGGKTDGR